MAVSAAWAAVAVSAGSAYNARENSKDQKKAQQQAMKNAQKADLLAEEDMNRANQKRASSLTALSSNQMAAKGGMAGTLLTGPGGINASQLSLGKTTLLGGGG